MLYKCYSNVSKTRRAKIKGKRVGEGNTYKVVNTAVQDPRSSGLTISATIPYAAARAPIQVHTKSATVPSESLHTTKGSTNQKTQQPGPFSAPKTQDKISAPPTLCWLPYTKPSSAPTQAVSRRNRRHLQ